MTLLFQCGNVREGILSGVTLNIFPGIAGFNTTAHTVCKENMNCLQVI